MLSEITEIFMPMLAEKSAEVIMPWYANNDLAIEAKSDESPVTKADKDAEEVLRGIINKNFPDHGIIGEEFGEENVDAEYVWTLDPIDGTKSFITAVPLFGTLVGLMQNGKPIAGFMHQPVLKQLCIGSNNCTTINGKTVRCRQESLANATLLSSDTTIVGEFQNEENWNKLVKETRLVRTWGDCYGYYLIAGGWADVMADPILEIWDLVPLIPIIKGAGAVITDWQGNEHGDIRKEFVKSAVAAHPENHDQVIKILNG